MYFQEALLWQLLQAYCGDVVINRVRLERHHPFLQQNSPVNQLEVDEVMLVFENVQFAEFVVVVVNTEEIHQATVTPYVSVFQPSREFL